MRKISIALLGVALTALSLSACAPAGGEGRPDESASASRGPASPAGPTTTIDPLDGIEGAKEWTTDGVVISVPEGLVTKRETVENGVRLLVYDEADAGEVVTVTLPSVDAPVSDGTVDDQTALTSGALTVNGATVESGPAAWSGWAYGNAVRGTLESDGTSIDALEVDMRDEDATMLVLVMARTGKGQSIEDTWQYEVMRTLRKAG